MNSSDEARIGSRFGAISVNMMRHRLSPMIRDASTKSRLRSDMVWARSTRAPHAQPVSEITSPITKAFDRLSAGR